MTDALDVREYDVEWPARFEQLSAEWHAVLPATAVIEHVGSTAVPGLPAKACLDVSITVAPSELGSSIADLVEIGLEHRPDSFASDPRRHFLRLVDPTGRRVAHAHLFTYGHPAAQAMTATRDLLRRDERWRGEYGELKRALVARCAEQRTAYIDGKQEFMQKLAAAASAG